MSADEKLGVDVLDELAEPPADEVDGLVLDELESDADGVDEDEDDGVLDESPELLLPESDVEDEGVLDDEDGELDEEDGDDEDDDDCATASVDSAKSTAAVMMLRVLGMDWRLQLVGQSYSTLGVQAVYRRSRPRDCL